MKIVVAALCGLVLIALAGIVLTGSKGSDAGNSPVSVTDQTSPNAAVAVDAPVPAIDTNNTFSNAGGEFASQSQASPFAKSDPALKESYDRALIAFQIGDYSTAVNELDDLALTPDLTTQQVRAVDELLAKSLKMAPDTPRAPKPEEAAQSVPATASAGEDVFASATPALQRSYSRALAASKIGDYANALAELKDLIKSPGLNSQQKYAVQVLLDKTPQ